MNENNTFAVSGENIFTEKDIKQIMFSMVSGDIYEIEFDEFKNMDKYQIPLIKYPPQSCRRCYGRMHDGFNIKLKLYLPCPKCVNRCVNFKLLHNENIEVETIKNA